MNRQFYYPAVRNKEMIIRSFLYRLIRSPYLIIALTCYLFIGIAVFLYLQQSPVYQSTMSLVLPGTGSSSNFSIEEVGQANLQTKTPFSAGDFNPRVNYREIIKSGAVLKITADTLGLDIETFEKPKVLLPERSSILTVSVDGFSAYQSTEKAWALYDGFQKQLDNLRADEIDRHSEGVTKALKQYEVRLNETRQAVIDFQQRSLLVSTEQFDLITLSLSDHEQKHLNALALLNSKTRFVQQLGVDLGVSPSLAGQAFTLNTDTQFIGYLRELDDSSALISSFTAKWGKNHPKVRAEKKRFDKTKEMLLDRSVALVGQQTAETLHTMNLTASPNRSNLFAELVEAHAQVQAEKAKADSINLATQKIRDQVKIYARELAELERLEREARLAEAVYTSAAARLDGTRVDIFASYPVVQMLTPPSLPVQQKSPKLSIAILGAIAGFLFTTLGVLILWQRHFLVAQLLKKN